MTGLQQVRTASGQDYFALCSPCSTATPKNWTEDDGALASGQVVNAENYTPPGALASAISNAGVADNVPEGSPYETPPGAERVKPVEAVAPIGSTGAVVAGVGASAQGTVVRFAFGRAELTHQAQAAVTQSLQGALLATSIDVIGYTDATGPRAVNEMRAKERAENVKRSYIANGVDQQRIHVASCTDFFVADNKTTDGRAANRRAEIDLAAAPVVSSIALVYAAW